MGWAERVALMEMMLNAHNILVGLPKGRYHLGGKGEEREQKYEKVNSPCA